jgi:hypothetical protein
VAAGRRRESRRPYRGPADVILVGHAVAVIVEIVALLGSRGAGVGVADELGVYANRPGSAPAAPHPYGAVETHARGGLLVHPAIAIIVAPVTLLEGPLHLLHVADQLAPAADEPAAADALPTFEVHLTAGAHLRRVLVHGPVAVVVSPIAELGRGRFESRALQRARLAEGDAGQFTAPLIHGAVPPRVQWRLVELPVTVVVLAVAVLGAHGRVVEDAHLSTALTLDSPLAPTGAQIALAPRAAGRKILVHRPVAVVVSSVTCLERTRGGRSGVGPRQGSIGENAAVTNGRRRAASRGRTGGVRAS